MSEPLPARAPDFPDVFNARQLEGLRALARYACGCSSPGAVFPEVADRKKRGADLLEQMERRRRKVAEVCAADGLLLSRDDVTNFTHRGTNLSFNSAHPTDRAKLKRIFHYVYLFLAEDRSNLDVIRPTINAVYFPKADMFDEVARALYRFLDISDDELRKHFEFLSGVYFLYRYGAGEDPTAPEIVRSVVRIVPITGMGATRLRVTIFYKAGEQKRKGPIRRIEGVAIPKGLRLFVAGADLGTGKSPILIVLRISGNRDPQFTGVLLRRNTLGHTAATRIVFVRQSQAGDERDPKKMDALFHTMEGQADMFTLEEAQQDAEINGIFELIENNVPGAHPFMLTGL